MKFSKLVADRYAEEIDLDFSKIQETATLKSILSRRLFSPKKVEANLNPLPITRAIFLFFLETILNNLLLKTFSGFALCLNKSIMAKNTLSL